MPFPEDDDMVKAFPPERAAVPYAHSATASVAQWAGHECPWHEAAGAIADNHSQPQASVSCRAIHSER
jgi:hypothetical protein